jgi:2-C-methyl-D-erythritol 4-phosphate cytidylyltransferase
MKTVAIITASGYGKRMGRPKQFIGIGGKPILEWTLSVFEEAKAVDEIILVVNKEDIEQAKEFKLSKLRQIVGGGKERQDSVYKGLKALPEDAEIVAIHDGARPFVTSEIIDKAVSEAKAFGAVVVGVPVSDTIKQIKNEKLKMKNEGAIIEKTIDRSLMWRAQTPQIFKKDIILKAYQEGRGKHQVTDDAMLVEKLVIPVKMVMGSYQNIKITTPEDLVVAEGILKMAETKEKE